MTIEATLERIAVALEARTFPRPAGWTAEPTSASVNEISTGPKEPAASPSVAGLATAPGPATAPTEAAAAPRAEDRVPKDPPKRTSRQVGKSAPAAAPPASTASPTEKPLTLDDVRNALVQVQTKAGNKQAVYDIIGKHTPKKETTLGALLPGKYADVIADAKAFVAA